MKKNFLLGSIMLLLCVVCTSVNSFAQFEQISIFRDLGTNTPTIQKPAQQNAVAINGAKAPYSFSGGAGTKQNPYLISTAEDLINLASAVNSKAKNSSGTSYADAYYKMTANIDMGEKVAGPFIVCTQEIRGTKSDNKDKFTKNQFILKATQNADGSYTCNTVALDNSGSTITLTNQNDSTKTSRDGANYDFPPKDYKATFTYKYYGDTPLSISALSAPIGFIGGYWKDSTHTVISTDNNLLVAFNGVFDGDGYTISNFAMVTENLATGLFGAVNGTVKNVVMTNASIENASSYLSGIIAGNVQKSGTIDNCMVTNSTVYGVSAGAIVGGMTMLTTTTTTPPQHSWEQPIVTVTESQGTVKNCRSYNNECVSGSYSAGAVIGKTLTTDKNLNLKDNASYNNRVTVTNPPTGDVNAGWGAIVGGIPMDKDVYDEENNIDKSAPSNRLRAFLDALLNGLVPDFCYINSGFVFDPKDPIDKKRLETLEKELKGDISISQNLVLPDISSFQNLTQTPQTLFGSEVEWGNDAPTAADNLTLGTDYWTVADQMKINGNLYVAKDFKFSKVTTGTIDKDTKYYYYKIVIDGEDRYYPYAYNSSNNKWYFSQEPGAKNFEYIYFGWDSYPELYKTTLKQELATVRQKLDNADYTKYYKLTAPGTQAKPVVVNVSAGGGLYDKDKNLSGKKITIQRYLGLQEWNLIGITGIDNMGNGFNNQSMDNKVNFLSNTANKNDFAAVGYDYTANDWSSNYLLAKDELSFGQGIFVWPFNTVHPNAASGNWDFTTTTNQATVHYQTGDCSIYTQTGLTAFNKEISDYIKKCKYNYDASSTNHWPAEAGTSDKGLWYCFANPFTADIDVTSLLNEIGYKDNTNKIIQGWCVYVYRISALGVGSWERLGEGEKVRAGEGFMVPSVMSNNVYASTSADNSTADMMKAFSDKSLYGYDYTPWGDKNTGSSKSAKLQTSSPITFLCSDESRATKKLTASFSEDTHNNFDAEDALYMQSTSEHHAVEPYFIVPDKQSKIKTLCHDSFSTLPYSVFLGFNSTKEQEVTFALSGNSQDIDVYLLDGENDTVICKFNEFHHIYDIDDNGDTTITLTTANIAHIPVVAGNNEYKYKVLFTKGSVSLQDNPEQQEADINIWNNNREITINGKDLKHVEVFNALGQKVYESKIAGNIFQFNLNTIQGAYIIKAYNEQKLSKTAKIIIAK